MRRLRAVFIAFALLAPLAVLGPRADAGHRFPFHWESTTDPFDVRFIDSVSRSWDNVLRKAADEWSESDALDAVVENGSSKRKTRRRCPMQTGAVRVCNFRYGATGWAGLTQFHVQGKHIIRAKILLNETYLGKRNRKTTCHELGHGLGLAHRSHPSSCMTQGTGVRAHPDKHDYRMLERIYGHTHSATTAADTESGGYRTITITHPPDEHTPERERPAR